MPGGPRNPLGSRAMYLWQGDKTRSETLLNQLLIWQSRRHV
jgi:lipoprotein-anchoring transpeptidase ErfK/SrfK